MVWVSGSRVASSRCALIFCDSLTFFHLEKLESSMNQLQMLVRLKRTKTSIYLYLLLQVCKKKNAEIHLDTNTANISPTVFHHKPSITTCNFSAFKLIKLTKLHGRDASVQAARRLVRLQGKDGWFLGINSPELLHNSHALAGDKLVLDAINKYYSIPFQRRRGAACVLMNEPVC